MSSIEMKASSEGKAVGTTDQQLNRACEACRSLKVRCLSDPASPSTQCQRCSKAGRTCTFAAPQRKKPRKRTDARVAELEKEVRSMRSLLKGVKNLPLMDREGDIGKGRQSKGDSKELASDPGNKTPVSHSIKANAPNGIKSMYSEPVYEDRSYVKAAVMVMDNSHPEHGTEDVVDRGLLSLETANKLVKIYVTELVQFFSAVVLPQNITAVELRQSKPVLFLAVIAASALAIDLELSYILYQEIIHVYADRIFVKSEKSLELIQSILVTVGYCYPPDSAAQLQFYQYSHTAATMALDIGLGSKETSKSVDKTQDGRNQYQDSAYSGTLPDDGPRLENSRTLLTCYCVVAGLAMRLRRPNMLFFTNWMSECLSVLEKSPIVLDIRLAAMVNLQRIADEAATSFGFDDPSTSIRLTDSHVQVIIKAFERRMEEWKKSNTPEVVNVALDLNYYQNLITIYEFAIDGGHHDNGAFKHKYFSLPPLDKDIAKSCSPTTLSSSQINATVKTVDRTKDLLDVFLEMDIETLRMVPGFLYVRAIYSIVVLLKVSFAIAESGLGEVMDSESLKLDYYLKELSHRLSQAMGTQNLRVPSKWLPVVCRLQDWHTQHQERQSKVKDEGHSQHQPTTDLFNIKDTTVQVPQGTLEADLVGNVEMLPYSTLDSQKLTFNTIASSGGATAYTSWVSPHDALLNNVQAAKSTVQFPQTTLMATTDFPSDVDHENPFYQVALDNDYNGWFSEGFDSMNYTFTSDDLNLEPP